MMCPQCHTLIDDFDGFGVLAHDACGYCSHPSLTGGVCEICKARIEDGSASTPVPEEK
jgi:hypothetical protein